MARVYTYLFIVTGLMMLMYLAGVNTTSGYILQQFDPFNPQNYQTSSFFLKIAAIFLAATSVGVVLGYYFNVKPESYIIAGFCSVLLVFVGDMISLIVYYRAAYPSMAWVGYIINLFLFPVAIGYAFSIISFWRGTD